MTPSEYLAHTKLPRTLVAYKSHRRFAKGLGIWLDRALAQDVEEFHRQWEMMDGLDDARRRWFQAAFAADTEGINCPYNVSLLSTIELSQIAQRELRRIREEYKGEKS